MLKICFISSYFSKDRENEIISNGIGAIANANNALQYAYLKGLAINRDKYAYEIINFNMPNIGAYPLRYKKMYFKGSNYRYDEIEGENISFINLIGFKHYFKYRKLKQKLYSFLSKEINNNVIFIIYDLYEPFLSALADLKDKFTFKSFVIVPDLPGFTGVSNSFLHQILGKYYEFKLNKSLINIDGYILLCDAMQEKLPMDNKKYIVVEGIFNSIKIKTEKKANNLKILFYSGAMDERNGVINLLKAFSLLEGDDYRLILCGLGNAVPEIQEAKKKDQRIDFRGQLPREEIIRIQCNEATLLLNPRPAVGEFTKYSFPSKTMEYFASGKPVLMYKLPGVPNEYYKYCYCFEDCDPYSMAQKINEVCSMDIEILRAKGKDAQNFIFESKTPEVQIEKVLNFILNSL